MSIAVAASLAGCSSDETAVNYAGPYDRQVAACAAIASAGALRSDDGVPARIWIDSVVAEKISGDSSAVVYSISGTTHAMDGSGESLYDWDCDLRVEISEMRLVAQLRSFEARP